MQPGTISSDCQKPREGVGRATARWPTFVSAGFAGQDRSDGVTCKISAFGRLLVDCICFLGKWFRHNFATLNFTKAIENRRHLRNN